MTLTRCTHLDNPRLLDLGTGMMFALDHRGRAYACSANAPGQPVMWLTECDATTLDELAAWLKARTA